MVSKAPSKAYPALLTKISIFPHTAVALSTAATISDWGLVISNACQTPPSFSTSETRSGVLEGLRDVAITLWPARRAMRVRLRPKPEEQPVMSHTGGYMLFLGDLRLIVS